MVRSPSFSPHERTASNCKSASRAGKEQIVLTLRTAEGFDPKHTISTISAQWQTISTLGCADEALLTLSARETIHDALDATDAYLLSLTQAAILSIVVAHLTHVLEVLANPDSPLNTTIVLASNNKEESLISHYFYEIRPAVVGNVDAASRRPLSNREKEARNTIWIALVFRMLCWLLLHDFDKADAKIVPSDLKGSRMPIFFT